MPTLTDTPAAVATALLAASGGEWTYTRGATSEPIRFYKSDLPPQLVEGGNGQVTEVILASFRGLYSALATFGKPIRGDRISDGTATYEVQPIVDKCFYTVGGLVHIHTKKVG